MRKIILKTEDPGRWRELITILDKMFPEVEVVIQPGSANDPRLAAGLPGDGAPDRQ